MAQVFTDIYSILQQQQGKKKHNFFRPQNVRQEFYVWRIKIFFSSCNIQKPISNVSQDWYLQLSTQNSFKIELTTD